MPERTKQQGGRILVLENLTADDWFRFSTGISGHNNNWLLIIEQAANSTKQDCIVCMGPRPLLQIVPASMPASCVLDVMTKTNPTTLNCTDWDQIFPNTREEKKKPIFSKNVARGNFTCVNMTGSGSKLGNLSISWCSSILSVTRTFKPVCRGDIWWWCGDSRLFDSLPVNASGYCALITLIIPVSVYPMTVTDLVSQLSRSAPELWGRRKRTTTRTSENDPTYIDALGVPRRVPDEYKLVDQVAAGFESSICWWCTINKNVDRINYIHYNVQRLGNWTQSGFEAVHGQLSATSLMAFQNRIALDMLLAEKGGVCAMFGEQCCSFIPNNTASDGSLTKAIEGLRTLNSKMKEHSGVDTTMWDSWMNVFGKYRVLVSSVLISLAIFAAILTLCGCCCVPCLRSLLNRLITTAISPMEHQMAQMYPLLAHHDPHDDDDDDDETTVEELFHRLHNRGTDCSDLYPDLSDYPALFSIK